MNFTCFSLSPMGLAHPGIAVATSRAGGVGVLDVEFCHSQNLDLGIQNLERLLALVNQQNAVGLRLLPNQIESHRALVERLCHRSHWLILSGWDVESLDAAITLLPASQSRRLLLEVTVAEQIIGLENQGLNVDGLVAKGHESGGWVGEDSAFILTQKLLKMQPYPIYVQGGIGIHTAAACRAVGAAGIILDDQLWLMPESPFPQDWQVYLNTLGGQETVVIGERLQAPCRVLSRPGFKAISSLQHLADQLELEEEPSDTELRSNVVDRRAGGEKVISWNTARYDSLAQTWRQQAQTLIGWGFPNSQAWPMGQSVGLAARFRDRYQTTGKLVQELLQESTRHLNTASQLSPLQPNAPLARSHCTQYPIVQGPMTRVSNTAAFAEAVAQGGALPMLALALMRGPQVRALLQQTQELLGSRPWGIGILGFVPQGLREEQLAAVMDVKPPFALIAGGRPDQAIHLEAQGIATYIHVPTPNLLKLFLEQGAKRFVFEGRECGGHVGPLSSFNLWESCIETLLQEVPKGAESKVHVLFAGGIHDANSAAMVSAMAAPLAERGMYIGVLMGTAYLFTAEAVSCGAIVEDFQAVALACSQTINLETGPGHASRCAVTPFAQEFYKTRRQMMAAKRSPEEIKTTLEDLTLGRLRLASKGLVRNATGEITQVDSAQQRQNGMYMIGQVVTMRSQVCTIAQLHQDVCQGSADRLVTANAQATETAKPTPTPADIAIIGIGTLLPQAQYPETFWYNILHNVNAITEIPSHRWDWRLYYDPDRSARDKVYSKWGGFLDEIPFDPLRFGIPPKSLNSIEPLQLLTLETVRRALADTGYESGNFDREHTSVILGAGGGLADLGQHYGFRAEIPRFVAAPSTQIWERLPEWTEESFPGLLLNVAAGRVANRFDLGGSNYTVDAACASSLAAISLAVKELESGRSNLAIAGGIDTVQSPFAYLCFSKTQALSPSGKPRTFDKSADGIVISEGLAIVVLKRLADAERDGDHIYAVIKAVEGSSDGKALGLTAPLPAGQIRALKRAYQRAGFSPNSLGLYEAHGTGTVAGDRAEVETITTTLRAAQATNKSCALGSVKTLIGHTKCTAGVAGLVKVALALHHKVLPPHPDTENPLDPITDPTSPVYLLKEAKPWLAHPDYPRRGAVSAFGFGGTNFHAVLEEYQGNVCDPAPGAQIWPWELLILRAENPDALVSQVTQLLQALAAGAEPALADLAYSLAKQAQNQQEQRVCLTMVVKTLPQLQETLALVLDSIQANKTDSFPPHIHIGWDVKNSNSHLAFMFPGQGTPYPDMAREIALYFPEMRQALELADSQLQQSLPKRLSQYIYPCGVYSDAEEQAHQQQLIDTRVAQPAIGTVEMGLMAVVRRLGLEPTMVCGHSFGEYTALHCAGVLSRPDFLYLSATRGPVMAVACEASDGAMAAVKATSDELQHYLQGIEGVVIANYNAPSQIVISGEKPIVAQLVDRLKTAGIMARMLPLTCAFHSPLVASAQTALTSAIANVTMRTPQIPVYANATAQPYPADALAIHDQLAEHLVSPVNFVGQINGMYAAGARIFVEVGPKTILTNLVGQILTGKDHTVVALDGQGGGLRGFLIALGTLVTAGVDLNLTALFKHRDVKPLELSRLVELTSKPPLSPTTWLLHGGTVRPQNTAIGYTGKLPPLTLETATQEKTKGKWESVPIKTKEERREPPTSVIPQPNQGTPTSTASPPSMPTINHRTIQSMSSSESAKLKKVETSQNPINPKVSDMQTSNPYPQPTVTAEVALAAYQAYQETMRQFLGLQEQVMKQFLGGISPSSPPPAASPSVPLMQTQFPHGRNGFSNDHPDQGHQTEVTTHSPQLPLVNQPESQPKRLEYPSPQLHPVSQPTPAVAAPDLIPEASRSEERTDAVLINQETLTQILLQLVSDRTGYPTEMLGLEQDIEAELGIDSIKRVEILGALPKKLPESLGTKVQSQMENLTRVKSLKHLIEQLMALSSETEEETCLGKS